MLFQSSMNVKRVSMAVSTNVSILSVDSSASAISVTSYISTGRVVKVRLRCVGAGTPLVLRSPLRKHMSKVTLHHGYSIKS